MAEYITKEQAVGLIEQRQKELCPVGRYGRNYVYGSDREKYDDWDEIIDEIENMDASDVAEVRHGKWEEASDGDGIVCSECRTDFCTMIHETEKFRFCPNCGARMDKEAENA